MIRGVDALSCMGHHRERGTSNLAALSDQAEECPPKRACLFCLDEVGQSVVVRVTGK